MPIQAGLYPPLAGNPTITSFGNSDAVAEYDLALSQNEAYNLNLGQVSNYKARFADFLKLFNLGQQPASSAPAVPSGYMVLVTPGEANSWNIALVRQGPPVCDPETLPTQIVLPQPTAPNTIHVGNALGGGWFSAGQDDTFPNGKKTPPVTSDDGVFGIFEKFGAAAGSGWYDLLVSLGA